MVKSDSHGRSATAVADRLSLVFHVVDSLPVLLPKRRMAADERYQRAYTPPITYGAGEPLKDSLLMLSLEYGPVYLWLAYYCRSARRMKLSTVSRTVVKYTVSP